MFKHSFNSCRGRSSLKGGQIIYKIIYVSYLLLCAWFKNSNYFSEFCRLARWIVILLISPRLTILYLAGWSAGNSTQLTWLDISFFVVFYFIFFHQQLFIISLVAIYQWFDKKLFLIFRICPNGSQALQIFLFPLKKRIGGRLRVLAVMTFENKLTKTIQLGLLFLRRRVDQAEFIYMVMATFQRASPYPLHFRIYYTLG